VREGKKWNQKGLLREKPKSSKDQLERGAKGWGGHNKLSYSRQPALTARINAVWVMAGGTDNTAESVLANPRERRSPTDKVYKKNWGPWRSGAESARGKMGGQQAGSNMITSSKISKKTRVPLLPRFA